MITKEPLLKVKDLEICFQQEKKCKPVIHKLSFSIPRGKCLGIVGESGSGKSVTALAIMQLLPRGGKVTKGEIMLNASGEKNMLTTLNEKRMQMIRGTQLAMIFQEPMSSLNPAFTCGRQLTDIITAHMPGISRTAITREAIRLFEEVKLPGPVSMLKRYPHQLSGGQRQRVMIAMALAGKPDLLIADEPTTALDVTVQQSILDLLISLQKKYHPAILFITHDLGVIARIADHILVMHKGTKIEEGPAEMILNHPHAYYTKALLECRPSIYKKTDRLPVIGDNKTESQMHQTFHRKDKIETSPFKGDRPLLEVSDLSVYFPSQTGLFTDKGKKWIIHSLDFKLYTGEVLGLAGESGCGKTTLGRTLLKMIRTYSGHIFYKGKDTASFTKNEMRIFRKNTQIIFQDPYASLNPKLTIRQQIMEPMRFHGIGEHEKDRLEKATFLLRRTGLDQTALPRFPHEFSGGQRQRIGIARALAVEPEFLICDESVSSLDVSVQAQVLNLLKDLKEEFGLTYIFISHDLAVVKFMSDRILIMKDGNKEELAETETLFNEPKSDYTRTLIRATPEIKPLR